MQNSLAHTFHAIRVCSKDTRLSSMCVCHRANFYLANSNNSSQLFWRMAIRLMIMHPPCKVWLQKVQRFGVFHRQSRNTRTDRQTDRQTDGHTDNVIIVYPHPPNLQLCYGDIQTVASLHLLIEQLCTHPKRTPSINRAFTLSINGSIFAMVIN